MWYLLRFCLLWNGAVCTNDRWSSKCFCVSESSLSLGQGRLEWKVNSRCGDLLSVVTWCDVWAQQMILSLWITFGPWFSAVQWVTGLGCSFLSSDVLVYRFLLCGWKKALRDQRCSCLYLQVDLVLLQNAPGSSNPVLCRKQRGHAWHDVVPEFRSSSTASRSELVLLLHSMDILWKMLHGCGSPGDSDHNLKPFWPLLGTC